MSTTLFLSLSLFFVFAIIHTCCKIRFFFVLCTLTLAHSVTFSSLLTHWLNCNDFTLPRSLTRTTLIAPIYIFFCLYIFYLYTHNTFYYMALYISIENVLREATRNQHQHARTQSLALAPFRHHFFRYLHFYLYHTPVFLYTIFHSHLLFFTLALLFIYTLTDSRS